MAKAGQDSRTTYHSYEAFGWNKDDWSRGVILILTEEVAYSNLRMKVQLGKVFR